AALIPPSAAPEWLRVGWIFETIATSAPASNASIAARMPARPAPITSTSCRASTSLGRYTNGSQACRSRSRRSFERDPRGESRQLLILRPRWPDVPPQLVDPAPQLACGYTERRLALLPDRPLRDRDGVEPARLRALQ